MVLVSETTEPNPENAAPLAEAAEIVHARQLDFSLARPDFDRPEIRAERGSLMGMALGVKPAIGVDSELAKRLGQVTEAAGIEVITEGNFLVNCGALERRLSKEPALAADIGWNSERSIAENLQDLTLLGTDSISKQERVGFVLGYPGTAIREYGTYVDCKNKGIPTLLDFWRAADFPEQAQKLNIDTEVPVVAAAFAHICAERKSAVESLEGVRDEKVRNQLYRELAEKTRAAALYLMQNCFSEKFKDTDLTPEQAADMYSRVVDRVFTEAGID